MWRTILSSATDQEDVTSGDGEREKESTGDGRRQQKRSSSSMMMMTDKFPSLTQYYSGENGKGARKASSSTAGGLPAPPQYPNPEGARLDNTQSGYNPRISISAVPGETFSSQFAEQPLNTSARAPLLSNERGAREVDEVGHSVSEVDEQRARQRTHSAQQVTTTTINPLQGNRQPSQNRSSAPPEIKAIGTRPVSDVGAAMMTGDVHQRRARNNNNINGGKAGPPSSSSIFPRRPSSTSARERWHFYPRYGLYRALVMTKRLVSATMEVFRPLTYYQDPSYVQENLYPKHVPLRLYSSREEALNCGLLSLPTLETALVNGSSSIRRSKRTLCLNTSETMKWRFKLYDSPDAVPLAVLRCESASDAFGEVEHVPSQWQLRGSGEMPVYTNFNYPFPERFTQLSTWVSRKCNPTGVYRLEFELPQDKEWRAQSGESIFLIFHGAGPGVEVYFDGHRVGYAEDSMTEKEFELRGEVWRGGRAGRHVLIVVVFRYCSGAYLEDQDMWRFSGIHRDVELQLRSNRICLVDYELRPSFQHNVVGVTMDFVLDLEHMKRERIERYVVRTTVLEGGGGTSSSPPSPAATFADPLVEVASTVSSIDPFPESMQPRFRDGSRDAKGRIVETGFCTATNSRAVVTTALYPTPSPPTRLIRSNSNAGKDRAGLPTSAVVGWSPDTPFLYTLLMEVFPVFAAGGADEEGEEEGEGESRPARRGGNPVQVEIFRFGFRDIAIREGQLLINGRAETICGVNRHEHDAHNGKVISERGMLEDVLLLKRNNFNAVRCCHYSNNHRFYELCDAFGIYVCDEANVETHGFVLGGAISLLQFDDRFKDAFLSRVYSLVMRNRNRTSVICWSLGNESGAGPNAHRCRALVRALDPSRPIQYEGGIHTGDAPLAMGDGRDPFLTDFVCPMYHTPKQIASYAAEVGARPVVLCEYAHCMGNSGGGLHLYWNLFRSDRPEHGPLQGGYIWDWVDQGLVVVKPSAVFHHNRLFDSRGNALPLAPSAATFSDSHPGSITTTSSSQAPPLLLDFDPSNKPREGNEGESTYRLTSAAQMMTTNPNPNDALFLNRGKWGYGGDFGEHSGKADAQFCANGLVFANRVPHPALHEAKYLMQPLRFTLEDAFQTTLVLRVLDLRTNAPPLTETEVEIAFPSSSSSSSSALASAHTPVSGIPRATSPRLQDEDIDPAAVKRSALPIEFKWTLTSAITGRMVSCGKFSAVDDPITGDVEIACLERITSANVEFLEEPIHGNGRFSERVFFRVEAALSHATSFAERGHVVAYDSFELVLLGAIDDASPYSRSDFRFELSRVPPNPVRLLSLGESQAWYPSPACRRISANVDSVAVSLTPDTRDASLLVARAPGYEATIDTKTGALSSLRAAARGAGGVNPSLLASPVDMACFYRAPVDNDKGGVEKHIKSPIIRRLFVRESLYSFEGLWEKYGLDRTRVDPASVRVRRSTRGPSSSLLEAAFSVVVEGKPTTDPTFTVRLIYEFLPHEIAIHVRVKAGERLRGLRTLPRVGCGIELVPSLGDVTYCGRGDFENYPDRKAAAKMGVYRCSADDFHVPYLYPTENGGRSDVRWVEFRESPSVSISTTEATPDVPIPRGAGVRLTYTCDDSPPPEDFLVGEIEPESFLLGKRPVGTRGAQLNVSRFTVRELARAGHQYDLLAGDVGGEEGTPPPKAGDVDDEGVATWERAMRKRTIKVHLDTAHCGLGGDVSWLPSVHAPFLISPASGVEEKNGTRIARAKAPMNEWSYRLGIAVLGVGEERTGSSSLTGASRKDPASVWEEFE